MVTEIENKISRNCKCYSLDIKDWFGSKLRNINIKVTSNKTKQVKAGSKLNDNNWSYTKLINDLSRKVSKEPKKGLRKDLNISLIMILLKTIGFLNH